MQTATIIWVDPTVAFDAIELSIHAPDAQDFQVLGNIQPGAQTASVPDLTEGLTYTFRAVTVKGDQRSNGALVTATAPGGEPPPPPPPPPPPLDDVTGLQVSFSAQS